MGHWARGQGVGDLGIQELRDWGIGGSGGWVLGIRYWLLGKGPEAREEMRWGMGDPKARGQGRGAGGLG
jgi:hypothetical protein